MPVSEARTSEAETSLRSLGGADGGELSWAASGSLARRELP